MIYRHMMHAKAVWPDFGGDKKEKFSEKKFLENFVITEKGSTFAAQKRNDTLPCGVMVARRILVPPVRVRILPRQQKKTPVHDLSEQAFFYSKKRIV